ncbi:MAG: hypothetical protein V4613_09800 [Bacteroidota bacterium]
MRYKLTPNHFALLAFIVYSLVFMAYTWPLMWNFSTHFIGKPLTGDSSTYVWNIWHFRYAIMQGSNPFTTDMLFYPDGTSLVMHAYTPIAGIINLPLNQPILALNIVLYLSFIFSGLGTFYLLKHFNINPFLCIIGGFIFSFFPYKTAHLLEHFNLELTACIPYFILYFFKTFALQPGRFLPVFVSGENFIYLIIICILSLLSDYYYSIYLFYFTILLLVINFSYPRVANWSLKRKLFIGIGVLIVGHFIVRGLAISGIDDKGALWWTPDMASLFVPSSRYWLFRNTNWLSIFEQQYFRYPESVEFILFPGFCLFILVIIFWLFRKKNPIILTDLMKHIGIAGIIFLLCCFPVVVVLGRKLFYSIFGLIYYIPFLNNVRTPSRYILMAVLLILPVLLAGIQPLLSKYKHFKWIFAGIVFLAFVEFWPIQYPLISEGNVPRVYKELATKSEGAILPIPFGLRDGTEEIGRFNTNHYFYQTFHEHPIIGGYISRLSKANKLQINHSSTALELLHLMNGDTLNSATKNNIDLPIKYIVIEPASISRFEPYFDHIMTQQPMIKTRVDDYLLYEIRK